MGSHIQPNFTYLNSTLVVSFSVVLCDHRMQEANSAVVEMFVDSIQVYFLAAVAGIVAPEVVVDIDPVVDSGPIADTALVEDSVVVDIGSARTVCSAAAMTVAHSAVPGPDYLFE